MMNRKTDHETIAIFYAGILRTSIKNMNCRSHESGKPATPVALERNVVMGSLHAARVRDGEYIALFLLIRRLRL